MFPHDQNNDARQHKNAVVASYFLDHFNDGYQVQRPHNTLVFRYPNTKFAVPKPWRNRLNFIEKQACLCKCFDKNTLLSSQMVSSFKFSINVAPIMLFRYCRRFVFLSRIIFHTLFDPKFSLPNTNEPIFPDSAHDSSDSSWANSQPEKTLAKSWWKTDFSSVLLDQKHCQIQCLLNL